MEEVKRGGWQNRGGSSGARPRHRFSSDEIAADTLITDAYGWLSQSDQAGDAAVRKYKRYDCRLIRFEGRSLSLVEGRYSVGEGGDPTPSLPPYRYGETTFADDSGIGNLESMISCRSPDNARFRFEKVERHLCSRYPFVYASARCCYCYYYTISFIVVNESVITNYPRIDRIFPRFPWRWKEKERKREIGTHSFSLRVKTGTEPEIESIFHGRCFSIVNYASI